MLAEAALAHAHAAALRQARRWALADPALEPGDLVQRAWLKILPALPGLATGADCARLLVCATRQAAIDAHRQAARRPRGPLDESLASGQRVADEALARLALAPLLAGAGAPAGAGRGSRRDLALVLLGCGLGWGEVTAGLRLSRTTLAAWRREREAAC